MLAMNETLWPTPSRTAQTGNHFSCHVEDPLSQSCTDAYNATANTMQAMVQLVTSQGGTNTPTLGDRGTTTDAELLCQLAQLHAEAHVSARASAHACELLCGGALVRTLGKSTPLKALCGFSEACFRWLCRELSKEISIALGCDACSTWFDRCVFEARVTCAIRTELLDVVDIVAKGAAGCLQCILDMWEQVQNTRRELRVPVSKLYHISTLYA